MMLGCLLAAGHDQNHLLNTYSWGQLTLQTACIMRYHMSVVEMVAEPLLEAMDAEFSGGSVTRARRPSPAKKRPSSVPREQRDDMMMAAFGATGARIETVRSEG